LFESLTEVEASNLVLDDGTQVKEFRQMYKVAEKLITEIERATL